MKVFGLIFIILGSILILLNLLVELVSPGPGPGTEDVTLRIAYYIGFNFIAIVGVIFLSIGFWLRRKAKKRKAIALVNDLFQDRPNEEVISK